MVTSIPAKPHAFVRFAARFHLWKPARYLAQARQALQAGELDTASEFIERAMYRAPGWADPHFLKALVLREQGIGRAAEEVSLLAALERNPLHHGAEQEMLAIRAWRHEPLTNAWHLYYGKRYVEALEAFRAALLSIGTRLPESERAACLAGIGWCHHGYGRADWGLQAFSEALLVEPDLAHALNGKGICLYLLGRYLEAETALGQALVLEPRLLDAKCFIGWSLYARGAFTDAMTVFAEVLAKREAIGDAHWGLAWCAWRLDNVEQAANSFARALTLAPHHPSHGDFLALVIPDARYAPLAGKIGCPLPPVESCARAPYPAYLTDAMEALVTGKPEIAIELLEQTKEHSARFSWRRHLLVGRALVAQGNHQLALEAFDLAHGAAPLRAEPIVAIAVTLRSMKRSEEAEVRLIKALKKQPNNSALLQAQIDHVKECGSDSAAQDKQEQSDALLAEALKTSRNRV